MPAFHLLRCMVSLGGDHGNQVYRDRSRPIVFPELPILQQMHGEEAVTDVHVVGVWNTTNEEVLQRLQTIYEPEVIREVFPGARPRLPLSDPSIPRCTLPIYKPRSPKPANPDPKLRPLDQFTQNPENAIEAPPLPDEDEPTPDEIAAHVQDEEDEVDLGLVPDQMQHIVRDTSGRGSAGRRDLASRITAYPPDVNAGGSHAPDFVDTSQGHRSHAPSAAQEAKRRG